MHLLLKYEMVSFFFLTENYNTKFINAGSLTEENTLFLEAWKTVDRAYVDKTFNGQSWFRYREKALKSEPMNTRGETCMFSMSYKTFQTYILSANLINAEVYKIDIYKKGL